MLATGTSRTIDLNGYTHFVDFGGPDDVPPLVFVHGLGGSHINWTAVAPTLAERQHAYALDLAGHGLTFPDQRRTDIDSNQRLLDRFLREVAGTPVVLMGNSMGGIISILQAARHPETVSALALIDPAVPGPRQRMDPEVTRNFVGNLIPGVGNVILARRRKRLSPAEQVQQVLDLCCVDTDRIPVDLVQRQVALATRRQSVRGTDAAFLEAARSVMSHMIRREKVLSAMRSVGVPVLLLHGDRDRLVSPAAAAMAVRDNPHWELRMATDIGHVPQMEAPGWTLDQYNGWIDSTDLLGQEATRASIH